MSMVMWVYPRTAAGLDPDDGAQRGRISFEMFKGLIWSQVKDGPPRHARTSQVYGDGPFRRLKGASRREEGVICAGPDGEAVMA
jgi:hypothetical protein